MSHRRGRSRLDGDKRVRQLKLLCAQRPHTVKELAAAMQCSDGLVRFYLRQVPMIVTERPQPGNRPTHLYAYHEPVPLP